MSLGDNLLRKLDLLEAALKLRQSGMPSRIVAMCYSDDPADLARAEQQKLDKYGITDRDVLNAAGVSIDMVKLPYAYGRGIGITSSQDPRVNEENRKVMMESNGGKHIPPIVGTKQDIEGFPEGCDEE